MPSQLTRFIPTDSLLRCVSKHRLQRHVLECASKLYSESVTCTFTAHTVVTSKGHVSLHSQRVNCELSPPPTEPLPQNFFLDVGRWF